MKLYNTLTKQIDDFTPLDGQQVRIYSCGPTVYDRIHIGNLSSFIYADTLRRALQAAGYEVKHVMNITDVDDKTIRRSQELYPDLEPKEALQKLTRECEASFLADMRAIGNDVDAIEFVRATDNIEAMQKLIHELLEQGMAYIADDGVYFSIAKYKAAGKQYGQLLNLNSDNTSEARIDNDEYDKESVHDFALWKRQKPGEPSWEFEVDGQDLSGRPGWHIECSAMSVGALGQPFDIHTGGVDLIFPHHENEIAQSTANTDQEYAKLFFHNEHLLVEGHKMSKSLNNFYTLDDVREKGFDPLAFRLLVLQSHYQSQSNFSWDNLQAAQNRLKGIYAWADLRHQPDTDEMPEDLDQTYLHTKEALVNAIENNLQTPFALSSLGFLVSHMPDIPIPSQDGKHTAKYLHFLDNTFGLDLAHRSDISAEQKQAIAERQQAKVASDWQKSDQIRNELVAQGIGLRDTDHGTKWFRL